MKIWMAMCLLLVSISAMANVSLEIDFEDFSTSEVSEFNQTIDISLNETKTFASLASNQQIEIMVSEKLPKEIQSVFASHEAVLIDIKLYEMISGEKKLMSSARIVSKWGETATMEKYKNDTQKELMLTLKVVPRKH
jgi:hypothetical protein